ncbi:MAG: TetR/AcrR family transcriptional regulator [Acidimicrobiia bacterium]|nr:TetR/AcrR family transcriptional regulator [Acidimicrobiia bacterium]
MATPQTKATREDWIASALDVLVSEGVEAVRVLSLASRLGVARSSFYWYFTNRDELLEVLLQVWSDTNTRGIVDHAARPAPDIGSGVLSVFECWTDDRIFNAKLDFAVREWARRSERVEEAVTAADAQRVEAIAALFERHGYPPREAFVRARVLYFMQIGYYALDLGEDLDVRLSYAGDYVHAFTGVAPSPSALGSFVSAVRSDQ